MHPRLLLRGSLILALAAPAAAQSSQFGIRGLGAPGRALSAKAIGTGGALGMFEGESSLNPAALSLLTGTTTMFTGIGTWRSSTNLVSTTSTYDARFPQFSVGGQIPGRPIFVGVSNSLFTDRDFTAVSHGEQVLREVPVGFTDSTASRGGINNMRLAVAWHPGSTLGIGLGADFLTGQNQLTTRRVWEDPLFLATRLGGEISYRAFGFTGGAIYQPSLKLQLSGSVQYLGAVEVRQDSQATRTKVGLPLTLHGAARMQLRNNMKFGAMISSRSWSRGDEALLAGGGTGANNTFEIASGIELIRNLASPDHLPLRVGFRHSELPFPLVTGDQVTESAFSFGSGLRFAHQAGGIDFALERATRKEGALYSESAWHFSLSVTVRTSGGGR